MKPLPAESGLGLEVHRGLVHAGAELEAGCEAAGQGAAD